MKNYLNLGSHSNIQRKRGWSCLFKKKSEHNFRKEFSALSKRVDRLEKELERVELLEKSLAHHEVVLAKKIADMAGFEEELKKLVRKDDFEELRKKLRRLEQHEELLAENDRFMRELVKELSKVKESHKLTRRRVMAKDHVNRNECEERFSTIREALEELEHIRRAHKRKAEYEDIMVLRKELHDRLSQLEYQNKLLMKYLKKVDELFQRVLRKAD